MVFICAFGFFFFFSFIWIGGQFPVDNFLSYGRILTLHYYYLLICISFGATPLAGGAPLRGSPTRRGGDEEEAERRRSEPLRSRYAPYSRYAVPSVPFHSFPSSLGAARGRHEWGEKGTRRGPYRPTKGRGNGLASSHVTLVPYVKRDRDRTKRT